MILKFKILNSYKEKGYLDEPHLEITTAQLIEPILDKSIFNELSYFQNCVFQARNKEKEYVNIGLGESISPYMHENCITILALKPTFDFEPLKQHDLLFVELYDSGALPLK